MKKVLFLIAALFMFATAASAFGNNGLSDRVETLEQQVGELQAQPTPTNGVDGIDGTDGTDGRNGRNGRTGRTGTAGIDGIDGVDGTNADNDELYSLLNKSQAANTAMHSVELNPDHAGLSVGVGYGNYARIDAGAIGIMYGVKYDTGIIKNVGYNTKAYIAEGGYSGVSAGITLGF